MKLELGMYIRDTRNGKIYKLTEFGLEFRPQKTTYDFEKASHNIIDLIEVGDIIKYRELTFNDINKFSGEYVNDIHDEEMLNNIKIEIESEHIKLLEILTHEQFENNCFSIGDE